MPTIENNNLHAHSTRELKEDHDESTARVWRFLALRFVRAMLSIGAAAELNSAPSSTSCRPDSWKRGDARGAERGLGGDPNKPASTWSITNGPRANHFSRPHFHPTTVTSSSCSTGGGLWAKFDPEHGTVRCRRAASSIIRQTMHWMAKTRRVLLIMAKPRDGDNGAEDSSGVRRPQLPVTGREKSPTNPA